MNRLSRLMALVVLPLCVNAAKADLVLSFSANGAATTFEVMPGATIAVPVYIVEIPGAGPNILALEGLFSAGARLDFPTGGATVLSAVLNPAFESVQGGFPSINNPGRTAATTGAAVTSPIVPAVPQGGPATSSILVATFTFQAPATIGDVTTLSTSKPQAPNFPEFVSGATGTPLDYQTYSNVFFPGGNQALPQIHYTSSITVVPEPTLLLALGVPVAGLMAWRRRRITRRPGFPEQQPPALSPA